MANPMFTATPGAVVTSPSGAEWRIGERVGIDGTDNYPSKTATLTEYVDGSWEPSDDGVVSAYFTLDDGWKVRPYQLAKLSEAEST